MRTPMQRKDATKSGAPAAHEQRKYPLPDGNIYEVNDG